MSNFIEEFKKGQSGAIKGVPLGAGLENITMDINGIQQKKIVAIGGAEKSGKTTFADYAFVIQPYLYSLENSIDIGWIYYTYEIDRINKEFDYTCFFLNYDFGISEIQLPAGITKNGKNVLPLSPAYLKGHVLDDNFNTILIDENLKEMIVTTYHRRIEPLFGEYDMYGNLLKEGLIIVRDKADNPTGLYKDILKIAEREGQIFTDNNNRFIKYIPKNPAKLRIIILDHVRKLVPERGFSMKQTIDKMGEYMVILRNLLGYTFVPIIHTNRNLASSEKINLFKKDLYPTSDDIKDSGNIGEDCDYLFTVFSPNDDKYNLKQHFDLVIKDTKGNNFFPNLKTIHLVANRHGEFPLHYKVNMIGNLKKFETIK